VFSGSLLRPTVGITGVVTAAAFETIAVSTAMPEAVKSVNGMGAYAWAFNGVVSLFSPLVCWCVRQRK
jgi:hypothetical protein